MSGSLSEFLHQFHFLRPEWLWGLLLLPALLWLVKRLALKGSGWSQLIAPQLLPQLLQGHAGKRFPALPLLAAGWCLALLAMAGPSWQKQPQPLYQLQHARVMILDMSLSQYATDLKPNRLTRMRFKAMDLLQRWPDGEVGLVAFSGEPFTISPLTDDRANLKNLIPSLSPEIMPTRGSRPDKAVESALSLLASAGYLRGELVLLTDEISDSQAERILQLVADRDIQIHLLAVGTAQAAPIKLPDGSLLKDDKGAIVLPQLDTNPMHRITRQTGGQLATLSAGDDDLDKLVGGKALADLRDGKQQDSRSERWLDSGYLLVLLLLPLCLMAFRKGILLVFSCVLLLPPASEASEAPSLWQSLWKNSDQLGHQAFEQQDYQAAGELFADPNWRGASAYRSGDYQQAIEHFSKGDSARDWYNRGNALAQLERYREAIDAYQQALDRDPELAPAKKNKQLLEQMQNQQSQENQPSSEDQSSEDQSQQDQSGQQQSSDDPSSSEQNGQSESGQGQNQQQPPQQQQASDAERSEQPDQSPLAQDSKANSDQQPEPRVPDADSSQRSAEQQQADPKQFSAAETQPEGSEQPANADASQARARAQRTEDKLEQQRQQQLQRWLEQVPDDPSLLLRNKMRLEYERRRQQGELDSEVQQW